MCGLFGFVRASRDETPERASAVFVALGRLAEQRGRDAAGFALGTGTGRCHVVKATGSFTSLWQRRYLPAVHLAPVALAHTRHASQGAADRLANAAPLVVGAGLVGTYNGDIDAADIVRRLPPGLPEPQGDTDSEPLLLALDRARGDLGAVCEVLSAMHGPAALAWVDPARPCLVFLARAALCPLALAWDRQGNLFWGSSPAWFRRLDAQARGRLGFQVERVGEGTVLAVAAGEAPTVVAARSFTPVARPGDAKRFPSIWAGLDPGDIAAFRAETRHRTRPRSPASGAGPDGGRAGAPRPADRRAGRQQMAAADRRPRTGGGQGGGRRPCPAARRAPPGAGALRRPAAPHRAGRRPAAAAGPSAGGSSA